MRVEVGSEAQQLWALGELGVKKRIVMASYIIWDVAVQNVGQQEGRWAISCLIDKLERRFKSLTVDGWSRNDDRWNRGMWGGGLGGWEWRATYPRSRCQHQTGEVEP